AREPHQLLDRERKAPFADAVGGALEVGEVVARHFLVRADEQVCELPSGGPGLREQLGDRCLQQTLGEKKRRLERDARRCAAINRWREIEVRVLIEKPGRRALKHSREELEQLWRGRALAALDHAQVGDRGRDVRFLLDAAYRQLLQRQSVAPAYRAQLGTEEMSLAQQFRHRFSPRPCCPLVKLTV